MKTYKKSRALLASSILLALAGCDTPEYKAEAKANDHAPTHGGDITVNLLEKAEYKSIDLLGTTTAGNTTNETAASDADNDYLSIKNPVVTTTVVDGSGATEDVDIIEGAAIIDGNFLNVRPILAESQVDDGETLVITVDYEIFDGKNTVDRKVTVNLTGEDFEPQFDSGLSTGGTLDKETITLELLTGVSDADIQDKYLSAGNMVADSDNPNDLTFTIVDVEKVDDMGTTDDASDDVTYTTKQVVFDVSSIEDKVTRGLTYNYNFTYDVMDHNHAIPRDITLTIVAVKDIPGTPLIEEYFIDEVVPESSGLTSIDLKQGITEREGDEIVISDIKIDGSSDYPYGFSADASAGTVSVDTHAFFSEAKAGSTVKVGEVTYQVADDKGNVTDGKRNISVIIQGEEMNLAATLVSNVNFEDPLYVGALSAPNWGGFTLGYAHWNCGGDQGMTIATDAARTGDYGLVMDGTQCYIGLDDIATIEAGKKWAFSYGLQNPEDLGAAAQPFSPIWVTNTGLNNKFWSAQRPPVQPAGEWREIVNIVGTHLGAWNGYEGAVLQWDIGQYNPRAVHHFDDISIVEFGGYDLAAHDMLVNNVGLFENAETITSTGGTVEIRDDAGNNKLFVDLGAESSVTVSLPIKSGAIKKGGRYALYIEGQLINHADLGVADAVGYEVKLSNGSDSITASNQPITWAANVMQQDVIISESYGKSADIDWSLETMTLDVTFTQAQGQYYIDNLRLIAIPE